MTAKIREGSIYRRCSKCGATLAAKGKRLARQCPKCGASTATTGNVSWSWRIDVAPPGEKRKIRSGHGYADADEAERALLELRNSVAESTYIERRPDSLGEYLASWLAGIRHEVSAGTWAAYEGHVRNHLAPRLGTIRLQDLTRTAIRQALADLRETGRVGGTGEGGLAPKTVGNIYLTLHVALESAVKDRLLPRNPADDAWRANKDDINPDRIDRRDDWWSQEDIDAFLARLVGDEFYAMWHVFLWTGARRGEVAAMRWQDIDLEAGTWTITRQWRKGRGGKPEVAVLKAAKHGKPNRQRRKVALVPATVEALTSHRAQQAKLRLLHGTEYADSGLVFCQPDGQPLHPDGISQRWDRHVRQSRSCAACGTTYPYKSDECRECGADLTATGAVVGPSKIRLHDARHSHATWCLDQGMPLHQVSRRLGHASIQITADTYGHDNIESAQSALDSALKRAEGQ